MAPKKHHSTHSMGIVLHFAINAVRMAKAKYSIKTTRKLAGRAPMKSLESSPRLANLDSLP